MSSTNRGGARRANDDYQTPPWAIEALLAHVRPFGNFLEPCRGSGNILRAVDALPEVASTAWCEIAEGMDFLGLASRFVRYDWIITNPPFSLACEFIEKSLSIADHVAMLLRVNFLGSERRFEWWQAHRPTALYVLTPRPHFLTRDGKRVVGKKGRPGNDSCEYAWFVWSRLYSGIHVISKEGS